MDIKDKRFILTLVLTVGVLLAALISGQYEVLIGLALPVLTGTLTPYTKPEPREREGASSGSGPPAGAITAFLLSGLFLSSCGPLTSQQGQAIRASVRLTCELLRTLLRPEVTGVSADVAMWADRACTAGEAVTAVVLPWAIEDEPSPAVIPPALPGASVMLASGSHRTVAIGCDALRRACLAGEPAGELLDACVVVQDSLRRCRLGRGSVWEAAP